MTDYNRAIMLNDLLERDFTAYYRIAVKPEADVLTVRYGRFDLKDMESPVAALAAGTGTATFDNNTYGALDIAAYEHFINQCTKPASFLVGRRRCDYLMCHQNQAGYVVLVELTSALGSAAALSKSIDKYPGGKYEKCEYQLSNSLRDLLSVPTIRSFIGAMSHRVCLMAYKISPHTDSDYLMRHPYERYLQTESKVTGENGAAVPCSMIEEHGFEYRRIGNGNIFRLA